MWDGSIMEAPEGQEILWFLPFSDSYSIDVLIFLLAAVSSRIWSERQTEMSKLLSPFAPDKLPSELQHQTKECLAPSLLLLLFNEQREGLF